MKLFLTSLAVFSFIAGAFNMLNGLERDNDITSYIVGFLHFILTIAILVTLF